MVIGIYCRFSSQSDKEGGESSLEHQKKNGIKFCELNGLKFNIYSDTISGGELMIDRKEGRRLIEDLEVGKIDGVWVDKEDRLYRNFNESVMFKKTLIENKKRYFVGSSEVDFNDESHQIVNTLLSLMSEFEKKNINRRTKRGLEDSVINKDRILGRINYGYKRDDNKNWIIVNEQSEKIIKVHQLFIEKEWKDLREWILYCNKVIFKGEWKSTKFYYDLFRKKTYTGKKTIHLRDRDEKFIMNIPTIIDKDLYRSFINKGKRLNILKVSRIDKNKKRNEIFNGLLYCSVCGKKLNIHTTNNRYRGKNTSRRYYRCRTGWDSHHRKMFVKKENREITNHITSFKTQYLDEFLYRVLINILYKSNIVKSQFKQKYYQEFSMNTSLDAISLMNKELSSLIKEELRLEDSYIKGLISETNLRSHKKRINEERIRLKGLIEKEKLELEQHKNMSDIVSWIDKFKSEMSWEKMLEKSVEEKRRIVRKYISRIDLTGRQYYNTFTYNIKINFTLPIFEDGISIDKMDYKNHIANGGTSRNWKKKWIISDGKKMVDVGEIEKLSNNSTQKNICLSLGDSKFNLNTPITNNLKFSVLKVIVGYNGRDIGKVNLNKVVVEDIYLE